MVSYKFILLTASWLLFASEGFTQSRSCGYGYGNNYGHGYTYGCDYGHGSRNIRPEVPTDRRVSPGTGDIGAMAFAGEASLVSGQATFVANALVLCDRRHAPSEYVTEKIQDAGMAVTVAQGQAVRIESEFLVEVSCGEAQQPLMPDSLFAQGLQFGPDGQLPLVSYFNPGQLTYVNRGTVLCGTKEMSPVGISVPRFTSSQPLQEVALTAGTGVHLSKENVYPVLVQCIL